MTRIFLADDHDVVRLGLRHLLSAVPGFEVIGEAADGRQVLTSEALGRSDVLVLDLSLPVIAGTEVLRRVRAMHPHLAVVVHSMHPEAQFRPRALEAGAVAYVAKDAPARELVEAVRRAARIAPLPPEDAGAADAAAPAHTRLSAREHQVFMLIVMGRQVADIAAELDVHSCTVSNHLAKIRAKLGVNTTAEVVRYAYDAGILTPVG